jgi:AcrR family transcriptional regulator
MMIVCPSVGVNRGTGTRSKRAYRSPLREQNARRTRQAVVAAATRLFVERGYAATSLASIAAAADVARPTAFAAFGSKPALLREALDQALAGDDEPVPVARRPWFQPVWEAATPGAALDAYAQVCRLINGRAAPLFEVVRRAADEGPDVRELWETLQRNRRAGAAMVVTHLAALAAPPPGWDQERAADAVWIFNDPAHFDALVNQRGWSEHEYADWTADQMRHALGIGRHDS